MEVLDIRRSKQKHKKYAADVIINGRRFMNVNFVDKRYQHYRDSTPLKLYAYLDHNDWNRKQRYLARHQHNNGPAGMLAREFLW